MIYNPTSKAEFPAPTVIERDCRVIEMLAQELAVFESIEEMGPETIRSIGRRISVMVEDIRRVENERV